MLPLQFYVLGAWKNFLDTGFQLQHDGCAASAGGFGTLESAAGLLLLSSRYSSG